MADQTRLRQILLNLLTNAVKFTPAGGRVTLRATGQTGSDGQAEILFSVVDNGIGIKSEDFNKIFRRFEQVDNILTRSEIGAGLGLAVTRQLVELHSGCIWFESTYGAATTFYVALPVEPADQTN